MVDLSGPLAEVVAMPARSHRCSPGWERYWCDGGRPMHPVRGWYLRMVHVPFGATVRCRECGRYWVCYDGDPRRVSGIVHDQRFRPERRRERRRRARRRVGNSDDVH